MNTAQPKSTLLNEILEMICANGLEGLGKVLEILFNEAMQMERSSFLEAAPYQRTSARKGYANGFKDKRVKSRNGLLDLKIPQVRGDVSFYPSCLEKGMRSEKALLVTMAEMYVNGVSTRKVAEVINNTCGVTVTSEQVSRATALLDEEFFIWRNRPLGRIPILVLDCTYEKVRYCGRVISGATLIATGVDDQGHRIVLGVSTALSEAEAHWREFLISLKDRGLFGVQYIVSDDHEGLKKALTVFQGSAWQRCQVHFQRNAVSHVPRASMRKEVAEDIRRIFASMDLDEATRRLGLTVKKYRESAPGLAKWLESDCPECFGVFSLQSPLRLKLRSTNGIERLNREIKRRTRVVGVFPNTDSLLRLVTAMLVEISEEWENGKKYLSWEGDAILPALK